MQIIELDNDEKLKLIRDSVTIVITTSPVQSNPSTEMIMEVIDSIKLVKGLYECRIIIIADGVIVKDDQSQRKSQFKSGEVKQIEQNNYQLFLENVIQEIKKIPDCELIIRETRHGYAENLKFCLDLIQTDFVMVIQHDQTFERDFDLYGCIKTMKKFDEKNPFQINYIGFMSTQVLNYKEFLLQGAYRFHKFSSDLRDIQKSQDITSYYQKIFDLPLLPLSFWYDKTHLSRVSYYKEIFLKKIYNFNTGKTQRIKNFVEDSFGQAMLSEIKVYGLQSHQKFGCYLLNDSQLNVNSHIDGRKFVTEELRYQRICKSLESQIQAGQVPKINIETILKQYGGNEVQLTNILKEKNLIQYLYSNLDEQFQIMKIKE